MCSCRVMLLQKTAQEPELGWPCLQALGQRGPMQSWKISIGASSGTHRMNTMGTTNSYPILLMPGRLAGVVEKACNSTQGPVIHLLMHSNDKTQCQVGCTWCDCAWASWQEDRGSLHVCSYTRTATSGAVPQGCWSSCLGPSRVLHGQAKTRTGYLTWAVTCVLVRAWVRGIVLQALNMCSLPGTS